MSANLPARDAMAAASPRSNPPTSSQRLARQLRVCIAIARPDHWIKNVLVLPGVLVAAYLSSASLRDVGSRLPIGMTSVCLLASANYAINEYLDRETDRHHPAKRRRPGAQGDLQAGVVWAEWGVLSAAGLALSACISRWHLALSVCLLVMGLLYNVPPIRTKDKVHLDVLSESVNNPIRLLLGWTLVTSAVTPPLSLVLAYWMGGAFLMAVKRFAEYRQIGDPARAGLYRRSFRSYTEATLQIAVLTYAVNFAFFAGVFIVKYKHELVLAIPLLGWGIGAYYKMGFRDDSPAQHPELLHRESGFALLVTLVAVVLSTLLYVNIPLIDRLFF